MFASLNDFSAIEARPPDQRSQRYTGEAFQHHGAISHEALHGFVNQVFRL
jgi:hypothetical protein